MEVLTINLASPHATLQLLHCELDIRAYLVYLREKLPFLLSQIHALHALLKFMDFRRELLNGRGQLY
jgi:hypothetical protein